MAGLASDRVLRTLMSATRDLVIDPPPPDDCIQPASIDLHLKNDFGYLSPETVEGIDPHNPPPLVRKRVAEGEPFWLGAGSFTLASTAEVVTLSRRLVAVLDGKSSLGRIGLSVHITAGYIDPGFSGNITLELKNETPFLIKLWPGMKIAQLRVYELEMPCARPYGSEGLGSRYTGKDSVGTVGSKGA